MGNKVSSSSGSNFGRVILSDGRVHVYEEPLTVAELMMEHPQQVVVEFHSTVSGGKRPSPLPADMKLDMNKVYLMVPKRQGKPASLSSQEGRQLLFIANSVLTSKTLLSSTTGVLPLFARICTTYTKEGHKVVQYEKQKSPEEQEVTAETEHSPDGRPEYLSRQFSGKGWKPSLDTIKENVVKKKVPHWLV